MTRAIAGVLVLLLASAAAVACGGANDTNFDGVAGDSPATGGNGASSQGGSGATSGSGGGNQGGASGTGGSASGGAATGGAATGGVSGTGTGTGGQPTGGSSGTGGTDPNGGVAGAVGGTSAGGTAGGGGTTDRGGGGGSGGSGGKDDCDAIVSSAQAALIAAQICNPATPGPRCTGHVQDLCNCTVPVDNPDSEATRAYLAVREAAMRCGVPCLAIVCPEPTSTTSCAIGGATTNIVIAQSRCVYVR